MSELESTRNLIKHGLHAANINKVVILTPNEMENIGEHIFNLEEAQQQLKSYAEDLKNLLVKRELEIAELRKEREGKLLIDEKLVSFLTGAGEFNGYSFGDKDSDNRQYWWRAHLPKVAKLEDKSNG